MYWQLLATSGFWSYTLTWWMPNNDDDDDAELLSFEISKMSAGRHLEFDATKSSCHLTELD